MPTIDRNDEAVAWCVEAAKRGPVTVKFEGGTNSGVTISTSNPDLSGHGRTLVDAIAAAQAHARQVYELLGKLVS